MNLEMAPLVGNPIYVNAIFPRRVPLCKVNPLHARRFSQASGTRAKTDKVDAQVLARMGVALQLEPDPNFGEDAHLLNELQTARRASL